MRQIHVEFACRYHLPPNADASGIWRWHRHSERLYIQVPDSGESSIFHLPPLFFTVNAAWTWRVRLENYGTYTGMFLETPDGVSPIRTTWRESEFWYRATFSPYMYASPPQMRGPWWLQWRVPGMRDVLPRMLSTLDRIDRAESRTEILEITSEMRREIILWRLSR